MNQRPISRNPERLLPLSNGRFAMWLFLSTEVMFFAGLFASFIVLKSAVPGNLWPNHQSVHVHFGVGLMNTAILAISSYFAFLGTRAIDRHNSRRAMICLSLTLLLGASFLAIKGYEYIVKVKSGIHPVPGQRQVFDVADIYYLAAVGHTLEQRIGRLEGWKSRADTKSGQNAAGLQQQLEQLYAVRSGLVSWTEAQVAYSDDIDGNRRLLERFALEIYCYDPVLQNVQRESLQAELASLKNVLSDQELEYRDRSEEIIELNRRISEQESTRLQTEQQVDLNSEIADRQISHLSSEIDKLKRQAASLTSQASTLRVKMVPLENRVGYLENHADPQGINQSSARMGLPLVIPGGGTWMNLYYLMTGAHALHLVGGMLALLICLMIGVTHTGGALHNSVLYWHFVDVVWLAMFAVFYW